MNEQLQVERGFAPVNGARLYYETAGSGSPLVLIHAGIADLRMWDDQFNVFAQHHRVIRYDMRGFGQSEPSPGPFSFHEDLYGVLRYLDVDRAHLIGVSMGGMTVIDFALAYPAMVASLIPVCAGISGFEYDGPMPSGWDQIIAEDQQLSDLIEQGKYEQATKFGADLDVRMWVDGLYRTPDQVDPAFRQRAHELARGAYAYVHVKRQRQPLNPPAVERLDQIAVPTLVIVGELDLPEVDPTANVMVERIPGARKVVINNTAHLPPMERPAEFNQIVLNFLGTLA